MLATFRSLCEKEVINICDGKKLGYVDDALIDLCTGKITSLVVVSDPSGICFGKKEEFLIDWDNIQKIGEDLILVNQDHMRLREPPQKEKKKFFKQG